MYTSPLRAMNFATRFAVRGVLCLVVLSLMALSTGSSLFAAQCGGLPNGWELAKTPSSATGYRLEVNKFAGGRIAENRFNNGDTLRSPSLLITSRHVITSPHDTTTSGTNTPTPPPCHCRGASCSPTTPFHAPDNRVSQSYSLDAVVEPSKQHEFQPETIQYAITVKYGVRYSVEMGILRPPRCM